VRPCHPVALRINQIGGAVAIAGIFVVIVAMCAAIAAAFGLASIPATAAFGMKAIPFAAALLALGGVPFVLTVSHAY